MRNRKRLFKTAGISGISVCIILLFCFSGCENTEKNITSLSTENPASSELRQTDPGQTEPAQTDPTQTDPAQINPTQIDPAQTDAGQPDVYLKDPYYIFGTKDEQDTLKKYYAILYSEPESSEEQFAVIREIANTYIRQKEYGKLINFLNSRVHKYNDDLYNTYYLFMIAYCYQQMDANPVAALYFDLIVKNYPDLKVMGKSIHLACLNQLITLVNNPQQKVWYYEELISRFLDQIDPGPAYFMLGQAYEAIGEWSSAIKAYTQYLPYTGSNVPGFPNADNYAKQQVDFSNSAKDWTFENLATLVSAVKAAMDAGSSNRLWQYHAKVNFFTRTWEQEDTLDSRFEEFNLADFMRGNRIRYAESLDVSSNANEAYLRTWGWSQYISTWYLYFRKIYFPSDPEIHGRWEWAGIYYGEKF
ncbi:MAG: tetratricopeptide repeat protein [Treponema sp.]|nr:tetratricopeptide repeat protein [Treponema sp.]